MILENVKKQENKEITESLAGGLIKHPMFMCFCPKIDDREKFIKAYLNYYIYEWSEFDTLLADDKKTVLATIIDPHTFEYKFKGKGARPLKHSKYANAIFDHRRKVREIVHIIAPGTMNPRVLTLYANVENNVDAINSIIDEAIALSNTEDCTLVYETFSQKAIPIFQEKGFEMAYQCSYNGTRFIQSIMVYYPPRKRVIK